MADIKWIKLTVDMFDDEKLKLIQVMPESDATIIIWIRLLSLAGKANENGKICINENMPYNEEMLSILFGRSRQVVHTALETLSNFGMIEILDNGFIFISNWEKHQNIDGMEKIRLQNAERSQKHRDKKKEQQLKIESNVTPRDSHATEKRREEKNREVKDIVETSSDIPFLESDKKSKDKQLEEDFEKLWKLYPVKTGSKVKAMSCYKKAIKKEGATNKQIQDGIIRLKNHFSKDSTFGSPPNGETYFRNERWTDEYETEIEIKKNDTGNDWLKKMEEEGL